MLMFKVLSVQSQQYWAFVIRHNEMTKGNDEIAER